MKPTKKRMSREGRREALIQIACALFAENGYDATTLKDVADRAGVSKALMSQHFHDKEEIYLVLYDRWIDDIKRVVQFPFIENSVIKTLQQISEMLAEDMSCTARFAGRDEQLSRAVRSRYGADELITAGQKQGSDIVTDTFFPLIQLGQERGEISKVHSALALAELFWFTCQGMHNIRHNFPDRPYTDAVALVFELLVSKL